MSSICNTRRRGRDSDFQLTRTNACLRARPRSTPAEILRAVRPARLRGGVLRLVMDDLLVVEGNGSLTEIGRCAIWNGSIPNCVHQNHIIRIRVKHCHARYLMMWWNSSLGAEIMATVAVTTAGLYNLSTRKVREFPVPLPAAEEQIEIVRRVDRLFALGDRLEARYVKAKMHIDNLTQSILVKAFRGELVPTDAELADRRIS